MKDLKHKKQFAHDLSNWYRKHQRDLPFRKTSDPYKIFLSEMMLQQTQVVTMLPYYERFIKRFPTIKSLAQAKERDVLKLWEGLGYYRRARYIHETAKMIMSDFDGVFPRDYKDILALKGVGKYTAGAIHSIAFNQPTPAVDGNVMRVMSRVLTLDQDITLAQTVNHVEAILSNTIIHDNPSDFTQGLMEIGALICTKTPDCEACPLSAHCFAYKQNNQTAYPIKKKLKAKTEDHFITFIIKNSEHEIVLAKRPARGLLANMLEFPQVKTKDLDSAIKTVEHAYNTTLDNYTKHTTIKHVFSHKIWYMDVYIVHTKDTALPFYKIDNLSEAMSRAHLKIIDSLKE
ncbi:MAG: A/G-specific adenine glycosylase [Bacillota bacterium]